MQIFSRFQFFHLSKYPRIKCVKSQELSPFLGPNYVCFHTVQTQNGLLFIFRFIRKRKFGNPKGVISLVDYFNGGIFKRTRSITVGIYNLT